MNRKYIKEMPISVLAKFMIFFNNKFTDKYGHIPDYSLDDYAKVFGISYGKICGAYVYSWRWKGQEKINIDELADYGINLNEDLETKI